MMLKVLANAFGVLFLVAGILGLMPVVAPHGLLLKTFRVNTALNLLHLFSGVAAIWCGFSSALASKVYLRFFDALYLTVAMIGFFVPRGLIFNHLSNNMADTWAHLAIAILFFLLGFAPAHEPAGSQMM